MKKGLLTFCLAFAGLTAVAQEQGDKAVGAQIVLGSELSNIGLG